VEVKPTTDAPRAVQYPRAADQKPAPDLEAGGSRRWITMLTDSLGLIGAVWGLALAALVVGIPIALAVAVLLRLGGWALSP
jgi:hypothetical protein